MNFCKNLIGAILLLFLGACSTSKEVTYFQDLRPGESELALTALVEIKIQPKDKLSILVNSQDLRLTNLFNLPIVSQQIGMEGSSGSNRGVSGYTVDSKGNIDFPVLGEIHIAGMTREEVAAYIKKELQSHDLIKDPVVTVEYMNLSSLLCLPKRWIKIVVNLTWYHAASCSRHFTDCNELIAGSNQFWDDNLGCLRRGCFHIVHKHNGAVFYLASYRIACGCHIMMLPVNCVHAPHDKRITVINSCYIGT